jgi:hypothetical protein
MAGTSHFPTLEGTIEVLDKNGEVKQTQNVKESLGHAEVAMTVTNEDGSIASEIKFPMKSFVKNMASWMLNAFQGVTTNQMTKDTAVTAAGHKELDVVAAINDSDYGVVVGLNNSTDGYQSGIRTTVGHSDYALRYKCTEGTGTNQFTHSVTTTSYTFNNGSFTISRTFLNGSGSTITVGEVGIMGKNTDHYLIARDVDTALDYSKNPGSTYAPTPIAVAVTNGQTLSVTYTFSIGDTGGLTNNFLSVMFSSLDGAGTESVKYQDIGGAGALTVGAEDFYTNAAYKLWNATTDKDYGFLVGTTTDSTARSFMAVDSVATGLTFGSLTNAKITTTTTPYTVSNTTFNEHINYVGAERTMQNTTSTPVTGINEAAITLAGSVSTKRVTIARFKFATAVDLNELESIKLTLRIQMIAGTDQLIS